jgi:uncharacterized membrane protein
MNRTCNFLSGACLGSGLGAGLMFFFDPHLGRRRRAMVRDQFVGLASHADDAVGKAARDLVHQTQGLAAETWSLLFGGQVDDRRLMQRVRSKLGRYVSHPHAIEVSAQDGRVRLSGRILEHERCSLVRAVAQVAGVRGVEDRLEAHRQPGSLPDLQGGVCRPGEQLNVLQENWSPGTRVLVGSAGSILFTAGLTQRFPTACILGTAGLALLARSASNMSWGRMLGVSGGRRAVDVHKTITLNGPLQRVFPFFADYANFPRFMAHVREVRDLGNGRSYWVAAGPGGVPVTWNAAITAFEPNRLIAWRSEPGSVIANAGVLHFQPEGNDRTRVDLRFSYNPPGVALGHVAAMVFGADARSSFDDDLVRLKGLIEHGSTAAPGKGEVARQEMERAMAAGSR